MTLAPSPTLWPESERYEYEERAGQIQFDGEGCSREESERRAERIVRRRVERAIVYPALTESASTPQVP